MSQHSLKYKLLWQGVAYAMLGVIFVISLLPPEHVQAPGSDKLHHLLSYAVLSCWCVLAFQIENKKQLFILALKLIAFGGMIELLQGLSGYRFAEWYDMLANSLGVVIGCYIAFSALNKSLERLDHYISQ